MLLGATKAHTGSREDLADLGFSEAHILALNPPRYAATCQLCAALVEVPTHVTEIPANAISHHRWHNSLAATLRGRL